MASELDATAVQSMVAAAAAAATTPPAPPAPTITDTAVDGSDYPLTHAFIGHFDPCAGGLISARMLIKLADGAGVLLVPVGRDSQATPAALRRVVRPALERFEYLLESAAAAGAVIAECVSVDSGVAELKSLEEAAGMHGRSAAAWPRDAGSWHWYHHPGRWRSQSDDVSCGHAALIWTV